MNTTEELAGLSLACKMLGRDPTRRADRAMGLLLRQILPFLPEAMLPIIEAIEARAPSHGSAAFDLLVKQTCDAAREAPPRPAGFDAGKFHQGSSDAASAMVAALYWRRFPGHNLWLIQTRLVGCLGVLTEHRYNLHQAAGYHLAESRVRDILGDIYNPLPIVCPESRVDWNLGPTLVSLAEAALATVTREGDLDHGEVSVLADCAEEMNLDALVGHFRGRKLHTRDCPAVRWILRNED